MRVKVRSSAFNTFFGLFLCLLIIYILKVYVLNNVRDKFDSDFEKQMEAFPVDIHNYQVEYNEDHYIVPNVIHYVQFGVYNVSFIWYLSIMSAILNHKPEAIIIHCDSDSLTGEYWERLKDSSVPIHVKLTKVPDYIFGKRIANIWHASDVARLRVLMEFGGIYLDNDVFVLNPLDEYRHYEFSLGWQTGGYIGNQVLIAERNATFLRLYYDSYHDYDGSKWYFNGGELPTTRYLFKTPNLVHADHSKFGINWPGAILTLFNETRTLKDMKEEYDTIHINARTRRTFVQDEIEEFTEENVKSYNRTFGILARSVLTLI